MANVLVVDDDPLYNEAIAMAIGNDHLHVDVAASADEALDIASRNIPEPFVISDWMLGGDLHGFDVIEALRAINPRIHVVVATGSTPDVFRNRAVGSSAIKCLFKPSSLSQFREALQPWLD